MYAVVYVCVGGGGGDIHVCSTLQLFKNVSIRYSEQATDWMTHASYTGSGKNFLSSSKTTTPAAEPNHPLIE
jgi:hypothetical protein